MEWELLKPWVNRVGIVLEFLSFWLAAPEILGEGRLRALERVVERLLSRWTVTVSVLTLLLVLAAKALLQRTALDSVWQVNLMLLVPPLIVTAGMVLHKKAVLPLLLLLADDKRIRQRSLAVGAVLFVAGFLCQCIATF